MGSYAAWNQYEEWNQALKAAIFTPENDGRPVYLDMDDDVLTRVGAEAGLAQADVAVRLVDAVRGTLGLDARDGAVLDRHVRNHRLWRRTLRTARTRGAEPDPPPALGLLAVLTMAAEEMQYDSQFAASAYYPRLCRLLGIDAKQRPRVESAYRRHAEELWHGLNEWLVSMDGRLGLPTAYAISRRYVGLPLSQALVRSADRRQFPVMFRRFGLPSGGELSAAEMEAILDDWIATEPCPISRSLQSLWQRGDARERIASVAAIELLGWDGATGETGGTDGRRLGDVRLLCWTRRFPRPQLEISFLAGMGLQSTPESLTVLTAEGQPAIDVVPAPGSRVQPALASRIAPDSLVEGVLKLAEESTGQEVTRYPRRVVSHRQDDLVYAYVECERVQLGEGSMILVKDERGLPASVRGMLNETARPGFREEGTLPGLPAGWVLFTDVQVVVNPTSMPSGNDLDALVPLLSSTLAIAGGTQLPGRMRKWSSLDPPEVRATVNGAAAISVLLTALDEGSTTSGLPHTWTSSEPALVADLRPLSLADGDYELSLLNGSKTVQQTILRLRSSDTSDSTGLRHATPLGHDPAPSPLDVLRAVPLANIPATSAVRGPYAPSTPPAEPPPPAPQGVWWNGPRPVSVEPPRSISVGSPDKQSCVVTGAHRMLLPTYYGHATARLVRGECQVCGFVKRYPAYFTRRQRDAMAEHGTPEVPLQIDVTKLPAVTRNRAGWDIALDSLAHAVGGGYGAVEYVAGQVEESSLFADAFARRLEARGDLEVQRGPDLEPTGWELSPPYLAELANGAFMLLGRWSLERKDALTALIEKEGGRLITMPDPEGPSRHLVTAVPVAHLSQVAAEVGAAGVVPDAAGRLVRVLPPLSEVESALPRVPVPGARRIRKFHLRSASWAQVAFANKPGGYRLESTFTVVDVFRTAEDIDRGEAALSTVQLSKHLAARTTGRPLFAYAPSKRILAVPLGADLPGLYGRAAVLCSGRLPTPSIKHRLLVYNDVTQPVANELARLLTT
jgi:hypothetical protein